MCCARCVVLGAGRTALVSSEELEGRRTRDSREVRVRVRKRARERGGGLKPLVDELSGTVRKHGEGLDDILLVGGHPVEFERVAALDGLLNEKGVALAICPLPGEPHGSGRRVHLGQKLELGWAAMAVVMVRGVVRCVQYRAASCPCKHNAAVSEQRVASCSQTPTYLILHGGELQLGNNAGGGTLDQVRPAQLVGGGGGGR